MDDFEQRLTAQLPVAARYIRYRLPVGADWEDVLQEVCITACRRRDALRQPEAFPAWLLAIARSRCNDWYRQRARSREVPLEEALALPSPIPLGMDGHPTPVDDVLWTLSPLDRQMLDMAYRQQLSHQEIALRLRIPPGTVKSRLHGARERFRAAWLEEHRQKGAIMNTESRNCLPDIMPDYTITPVPGAPFDVRWEELDGWLLVPRLGERLSWAMYDDPDRRRTWQYDMRVLGEAEVHGLRGVEIEAVGHGVDPTGCSNPSDTDTTHFVAQLTDTHCRYLACTAMLHGVKRFLTFLDGDEFLPNWGYGENNCGKEVYPRPRGMLRRKGSVITGDLDGELMDVVGRYTVTLGSRQHDTICVVATTNGPDTLSEQFIDRSGRTVLWRRFNRDDWALARYGQRWSERLPRSERLLVNGVTFVHWYDCLSDYPLRCPEP